MNARPILLRQAVGSQPVSRRLIGVSTLLLLFFASAAGADLRLLVQDPADTATFAGHGGFSADGLGQNGGGGFIQAEVPVGSTVVQAYLYGSYFFTTCNISQGQRTIDFDGTLVVLTVLPNVPPLGGNLCAARADVTAQVAAKVGVGGGVFDFRIGNDPSGLDGVALVVIYENPALPMTTVAVLDGGAAQSGDMATFNFVGPLDTTIPDFSAVLSLGIGFGFQSGSRHVCGTGQFSTVDVNGARMTTCAGSYDDGVPNNGGLITVGGVGDVVDNPPNPNGSGGLDDELYDLAPFLADGDLQLVIETANPSRDDIVFLAVIGITAEARVTTEICDDGIDNDGDGLIDRDDPDCLICGDGILDPGEECDDGNTSDGDGCSATCQNEDNQAPVALCQDATLETAFGTCEAFPSLDAGSYDPDGSSLVFSQDPDGPYAPGSFGVTVTVEDPSGASDSCEAMLVVIDPERPAPLCNAPVALDGAVGNASYTSGAADNCPLQVTVSDAACRDDDVDDDGVPDDDDECPESDQRETVIIEECDTGVLNVLFDTGCTISDRILVCGEEAENHGEFVSCVAHLTNELVAEGVITGAEKGEIQRCAAQSSIPEGFPPNPFGGGSFKDGEDRACPVTVDGTTLSFPELPGIGLLSWRVTATDPSGNSVEETCEVLVQNPSTALSNLPPAADAGPDQVAEIGATIQLDGTGSIDLDGGMTSYLWTLENVPAGSAAALSDPASSTPTFVVDLPGIYEVALTVSDGIEDSAPDRMEVQVLDQRPVADAGPDRGAVLGDTVTLDGSGSSDPDGHALTYAWTLAVRPAGSTATLSDPSAVSPTLTVDVRGVYVARLVVSDGTLSSLIDAAVVFAPNTPPVADAGPDQDVSVFDLVQLDGSGSSDFEGDPLTYQWTLLSAPEGSTAELASPTAVDPTFEPDVFGVYELELVVSDGFDASAPDTVTVTTINTPPVADAGEDQVRFLDDLVQLDGTGSSDAEDDPLTYDWTLINQPAESLAELSDPASPTPTFVADVRGVYVVELTVFDGQRFSRQPDTVVVSVVNRAPVAVIGGGARNAGVSYPVVLDGSGSFDPDDDPIGFQWLFTSRPAGSVAALSRDDTPRPFFTPDLAGVYVVELQVADGQLAGTATTQVTAVAGNSPPNADAGDGVTVLVGQTASLDGGGSNDPEGAALSFAWSFQSVPAGSALTDGDLAGGATATPSFAPDVIGTFVLELTVDDGSATDADLVEVMAVAANAPPHADPGPDVFTPSSQAFVVDGSGSFDPDAGPEPLTFAWTVVSVPPGSSIGDADLATPEGPTTTFVPDLEGLYVLRLAVSDGAAPDAANVVVHVDDAAPGLTFLEPGDGEVFYSGTLQSFTVSYFDQGAGLDLASFELVVAGEDVTAGAAATSTLATFTRGSPLDPGSYQAEARIADLAGNVATATVTFVVSSDVFEATADCSPTRGVVPLAVRFRSLGVFTGGSIIRYRWDFEGDGRFDTSDAVAQDYTRTFTTGGTREAVLEITNNFGARVSDTCTIQVSGTPPEVTVGAVPSNGAAPLDVAFTCDATDPDGVVALYEWDFEGDGTFDVSSPTTGSVSHTYLSQGTFPAVCRVTDGDGLVTVASAIDSTVRVGPPGTPTVTATATPAEGAAPLAVAFDGTAVDDGTIVLWEWDFDGDGSFDFSSPTSPVTGFTYGDAGIFEALLRVTDDGGLTSIDGVEVAVDVAVTLAIADDTFEPSEGETVNVETTLSGGVAVRVLVKNRAGEVLRTLFDGVRPAGTYTDTWDGNDDDGLPLGHGPYFVVVEYDVGGESRMLDLTNTTGGVRYNPPRSGFPSSFSPLEDDLLDVNFTIPESRGASEVTAFIGLFNVDIRFVTLLERVPFGAGSHTIFWDGTSPSGGIAVAPPGDRFLYGAFGFTLPDNAIMLVAAPTLSGVSVDPSYFDPATPDFLTPDDPVAVVTYDLDKTADVELTATNLTTGVVVRTIVEPAVEPGAGLTLSWDGRADGGLFADKGDYRLTLRAIDADGNASINRFALVRVFY